jgi:hypothetical protein
MSPNSLRVLAGAAAAVLALLTAIAVGLVSRQQDCAPAAPQQNASSAPPSPTATSASAQLGSRLDNRTQQPVDAAPPVSSPTPAAAPAPAAACTTETFATGPAVTALIGAGMTALAVLGLLYVAGLRRPAPRTGGSAPVRPVAPPPPGRPAPPPPDRAAAAADRGRRSETDRAALVRACIYVRDRVTSRALSDRLAAALHDAGVTVVEPVGDRFDPSRHEAGGATPTADPGLTGTIAAVEVPGYTDRGGQVLRAPVVTVYQPPGGSGQIATTTTQAIGPTTQAIGPTTQAIGPTTQAIGPTTQAIGPTTQAIGPQPDRRGTEEER